MTTYLKPAMGMVAAGALSLQIVAAGKVEHAWENRGAGAKNLFCADKSLFLKLIEQEV